MSGRHFALLLIVLAGLAAWPSSASAATCAKYTNQAAAQAAGDTVDADHDGIYCESLPCPCSTAPPHTPAQPPVVVPPPPPDPTPTPPAPVPPPAPPVVFDYDGDGVPDTVDACLFIKGGGNPSGCPAPTPPTPTPAPTPNPSPAPAAAAAPVPTQAAAAAPALRPIRKVNARVIRVTDGDTLKVRTATGKRITVRLVGIDTPETVEPGTPVECGGKRATAAMKALALDRRGKGRAVTLTTDPTQDERDRYGRLLAYVKTDSGVNLGRKLVALGWATTYVYNNVPFQQVASFRASEVAAKAARRGVYRDCGGNFHR